MIVIESSAMVDALVDEPVNPRLLDQLRLDEAIEDFSAFRIERHHMTDLLAHILDLRDNFTVDDAAYVILARALEAPLVTADTKMNEAKRFGVDVRVLRVERRAE